MTISRCITEAHRIAQNPDESKWVDEIKRLPETCPHDDCGPGATCRAVVRAECKALWCRKHFKLRMDADAKRRTGR
jgi:hypothetical protein